MRIDRMEPSKHIKGRYLIYFSEGDPVRVTENEIAAFGLYPGMELGEEGIKELAAAGGRSNARALGAKLLGARPLSRKELIRRMTEKEISQADAEAAADWLEELGVLDDLAYGQMVVRHYSGRGYGRRRMEQELYRRGVPRALWEEAMEQAAPEDGEIDRLIAQKLRGEQPDQKALKRVSDMLLRRGYGWEQVSAGLRRYGSQIDDDAGEA